MWRRRLTDWVLKRGILYVLTQMPMIAVLIGYFYRWTTYPIATAFTVIPSFIVLAAYVSWRRRVSDDPDEPAMHFGRLALWALVPYVVYNLARIPAHYLMGIVFWDHWYDYGFELTGKPVDQWSSLGVGTLIHSLQGYVLALGYFVLFKRVTFLNALLYIGVFLSLVYTWHFPRYVLVDFSPPAKWYFLAWWAHFWMAVAAYYVPKIYGPGIKKLVKTPFRATLTIVLVLLVYFAPVAFVYWRVADWQFPSQRTLDQAAFERARMTFEGGPRLDGLEEGSSARYSVALRFGPRPMKDYIKAVKSLDAGPVQVSGTLSSDGEPFAFCNRHIARLESPNTITSPPQYFPAVARMQFTDVR